MNEHDTAANAETAVRNARQQLDLTLGEVARRLSPRKLIDEGIDYLGSGGSAQYLARCGAAAMRNPIPFALAGVGVVWLMASTRHGSVDPVMRRSREIADGARRQGRGARGIFDTFIAEHPLAVCAIGLAMGVAVAAVARRTRR